MNFKFKYLLVFGFNLIVIYNSNIIANPSDINNITEVDQSSNTSTSTSSMTYDEIMQNIMNNSNNDNKFLYSLNSYMSNSNYPQVITDLFATSLHFLEINYHMNFFIQSFMENNDNNNELSNILKNVKRKDDVIYALYLEKVDIEKRTDIELLSKECNIEISKFNQDNIFTVMDELCKVHLKKALDEKNKIQIENILIHISASLGVRKENAKNNLTAIQNLSLDNKNKLKNYLINSDFKNIMKYINLEIQNISSILGNNGTVQDNWYFNTIKSMKEYFEVEQQYLQGLGINIQEIE